jgi:hypothetical protein
VFQGGAKSTFVSFHIPDCSDANREKKKKTKMKTDLKSIGFDIATIGGRGEINSKVCDRRSLASQPQARKGKKKLFR